MKMILENRENLKEYDIAEDWYKDRKPGISAVIRCGNEEEWIGPCLESILPFFDEIVITLDAKDRTRKIIETFNSDKIKVYDYPFFIDAVDGRSYPDSVHDMAYYTNWSLSKTTKKIVSAKWDADMIMLPDAYKYRDKILKKNIVRVFGKNIVDLNSLALSETDPIAGFEVRFLKVNKFLFYEQIKISVKKLIESCGKKIPKARIEVLTYDRTGLLKIMNPLNWIQVPAILHFLRIKNFIFVKDVYLKEPFFIHTRLVKKRLDKIKYYDVEEAKKYSLDKSKGDKLEGVNIPDCLFKIPDDYLSNQITKENKR